jgi:phosphoribosylanthranilate isomerase
MKIKICGIKTEADADAINVYEPDYCGFVFASSKRQVDVITAMKLRKHILAKIPCVGVFTDTPIDDIIALFEYGVINLAQLHGGQDETFIAALKRKCQKHSIPVIQAIRNGKDIPSKNADFLLYDGANAGSGETFDWDNITDTSKPWFLAGGINAENIKKAMALSPYCIDIASGSETDGKKDPEKIKKLIGIVRGEPEEN